MTIPEQLDKAIKDIAVKFKGGLSDTSTKKFDDLIQVVATIVGFPTDDIYITSVVARASNVWNRLSQGKPLNNHFKVGICIASASDVQGVLAPMTTFIGDGNVHFDSVGIIIEDDGVWQISDVATNAKYNTAQKIHDQFPNCNVHIVNRYAVAVPSVVRLGAFSLLPEKYEKWLTQHGVVASAQKYARSLRAISEPIEPHTATGVWNGLFEALMRHPPICKIFAVSSAAEFQTAYSEVIPFFNAEYSDKSTIAPQYKNQEFDRIFNYVHAALSVDEVTEKDGQCTRSAFRKYLEFLDDTEKSLMQHPKTMMPEAYAQYLAAIRTKPFVLLAGISGTGKSRMVRELARGCCPRFVTGTQNDHPLYDEQKPGNFETIAVRPNWHDSTELLGYISRISGQDEYQVTDFVKFLCKAWRYEQEGIPFFLCLDEMNLAPVEQYFAEYLSVIESRQHVGGKIVTDPLIRFKNDALLKQVVGEVYADTDLTQNEIGNYIQQFKQAGGIPIPSNLVVMGTVNMDETTFSFSRKVLDRAMSFELNEVVMNGGLDQTPNITFGSIPEGAAKQILVKGFEAYQANKNICDAVVKYLESVNKLLDGTPFKIAYRTRDEVMIYCIERCRCAVGDGTPTLPGGAAGVCALPQALDEVTSMKILSRIEGDSLRLGANECFTTPVGYEKPKDLLGQLKVCILEGLKATDDANKNLDGAALAAKYPICVKKLDWMARRLAGGFTGFWQ